MENRTSFAKLPPVLFSFYIVGFCNMVGAATSYVQSSFHLNDAVSGLLPAVVFIWFLFLSTPVGAFTDRMGHKKSVLAGMLLTLLGLLIPIFLYNLLGCFLGFALIGAGSVLLQLSLNQLLASVATGEMLTTSLTSGQMIKALSSFCCPFIAAFAMVFWGSWHYMFPVLALVTLLAALWLLVTPIQTWRGSAFSSTKECFALLKTPRILYLFLAILLVVGADVGMNVVTPKLMVERCGHEVQDAAIGSSVYFAFRALGAFVSTMLLVTLSEQRYLRIHILLALAALLLLFFAIGEYLVLTLVGVVGFSLSSGFALIYAIAIKAHSNKTREVSTLLMSGMCGGALVPLLMGGMAHVVGSQLGSLAVIAVCIAYLGYYVFGVNRRPI